LILTETKKYTTDLYYLEYRADSIIGYEVGYSLIDETDILSKDKMAEVFMKIIGRNRSILPLGHINQTDVVDTRGL
jgi:hypothetical protein